jgi:hypothetical protein
MGAVPLRAARRTHIVLLAIVLREHEIFVPGGGASLVIEDIMKHLGTKVSTFRVHDTWRRQGQARDRLHVHVTSVSPTAEAVST